MRVCVCVAGYVDHMNCLASVEADETGNRLDCFGIYPQVLTLSYDWALSDGHSHQYTEDTDAMSTDQLIYWSWANHLYVPTAISPQLDLCSTLLQHTFSVYDHSCRSTNQVLAENH